MKFLTVIRVEPRAKCRKTNQHRIKFVQISSLKRWNDACDVEQAKSRFALINNPQLFQNILTTTVEQRTVTHLLVTFLTTSKFRKKNVNSIMILFGHLLKRWPPFRYQTTYWLLHKRYKHHQRQKNLQESSEPKHECLEPCKLPRRSWWSMFRSNRKQPKCLEKDPPKPPPLCETVEIG